MSLRGKVALVTGSTSGIGLGIARVLAAQGADLVLNGFGDTNQIKALQQEIGSEHRVRTSYSDADISKPDQIARMVTQAQSEFGSVDILVNNAGIQFTADIEDFPDEKWDAVIAINLSASFHTIRAALPQMLKRNWGRIINIASAHGLVASVQKVAYIAAKLDIPVRYYRRMRASAPWLLDANVNQWLAEQEGRYLVRALTDGRGGGIVRALLSDTYGIINNLDVLMAMLDGLQQATRDAGPGDAGPGDADPGDGAPGVEITSCDLTPNRMYVAVRANTVTAAAEPANQ